MATLGKKDYYNKVYGCWLGKNCGGTLGAPLESAWGKEEMFDVWWYPELKEGGIPNDDLELQLIWLQALEDQGINIKAKDLAEYWLDCIGYNFDEYGLHKTNLKKGLMPPISGYYNNWFKHCMGSPIRSEIWACIAPGLPDVAAAYAYEDAIVDHAGGESVYGEMFNAALESAAFFIPEKEKLLEIGLSFISGDCKTAKAIKDAIKAYKQGMDWKEARNFVLRNSYSPIAQYSPVNLGFQTIGLLYGKDFADAICKAVNCGYDTDCTGATLGSILGIILGKEGLPEKWIKPLGDKITTNSSWEGITNVREPKDLDELTRRVCKIGKKVLFFYEGKIVREGKNISKNVKLGFEPDKNIKRLWHASPTQVEFDLHTLTASVDYLKSPVLQLGVPKDFQVILTNPRLVKLDIDVSVKLPWGWDAQPKVKKITIEPGAKSVCKFSVRVDDVKVLNTSNRGSISLLVSGRPQLEEIPIVFLAANRWLVSKVFKGKEGIKALYPLEKNLESTGLDENWDIISFFENELKLEEIFHGESGVIYLRHYVHSPDTRDVRVGLPSNCPFRMWLNGRMIRQVETEGILRPNYLGDGSFEDTRPNDFPPGNFPPGRSYVDVKLKEGWNQFFIKIVRKDKLIQAHFIISSSTPFYHGFADLIEYKFPWEV